MARYFYQWEESAERCPARLYYGPVWPLCFKADTVEEVAAWLTEHNETHVLMDVDGNGTHRMVPVEWLGDGEPLTGSQRLLELAEG